MEPSATPLIVELVKLAFEMTPEALIEIPPERESEVPCELEKLKLFKVEEAVVEVAKSRATPSIGVSTPPEYVVVPELLKRFAPEKLFESASRVEEAKVQVDVANEYKRPEELTASPPVERPVRYVEPETVIAVVEA